MLSPYYNKELFLGQKYSEIDQKEITICDGEERINISEDRPNQDASRSVASSMQSDTKDVFVNIKNRIKTCLLIQKNQIRRIRNLTFALIVVYLAITGVNSFYRSNQSSFAFVTQYTTLMKFYHFVFPRIVGIAFYGNFQSLISKNPNLNPLVSGILGNTTFEQDIMVQDYLHLAKIIIPNMKYQIGDWSPAFRTINKIKYPFYTTPTIVLKIGAVTYVKSTFLNLVEKDQLSTKFKYVSSVTTLNIKTILTSMSAYEDSIITDFDTAFSSFTRIHQYATIIKYS